jgi:hypothetical protein
MSVRVELNISVPEQHRPSLAFACLWYSTARTLTDNQVLVYIT